MTQFSLPQEHSIQLNICEKTTVTLICTDEALRPLIVGFLYNEGLIQCPADIARLEISSDHLRAEVSLPDCPEIPDASIRPTGLGGRQLAAAVPLSHGAGRGQYSLNDICKCASAMDTQAVRYAQTGGMHCSALFDDCGQLGLFEDVGRHNTLDKLAGKCLLEGTLAEEALLVTTGRISSDMICKAIRLGACVVASYSIPTQAAYELAAVSGITLIGYLKRKPTIYTFSERIR
ncbi:MAG: formate dehydrogenase accessory sulfurtransferase FdhD [Clostridiales bacterium]|nr:formate dehydrogenase accessory sulfurtransferase FdhD [Clostridiales bacterium]